MMMSEFEKLTGIYPTATMYKAIEAAYMEFDGDKQAFCAAYKENKGCIAEKIQRDAIHAEVSETQELEQHIKSLKKDIQIQQAQIARLEEKLKREQGWKPYEDEHNVKQADYENLAADKFVKELTDEEAADMLATEFGFDKSKIAIIHEVDKCEISRRRMLRKVGTYERKALFSAWDWNYIRFNVARIGYEMHDGELQIYWD